jgi:type IV pilus assembly protein PilM
MAGSLWKKEISLRRKATEAVYPEPPQETAAAEVEVAAASPLPVASGDYGWLTESFDPTDIPDEMPAVVAPEVVVPVRPVPIVAEVELAPVAVAAAAAKTPLWKKELSFKRAPKTPKAPKAAKAPKEPKAAKEPKVAKEPKAEKLAKTKTPKEAKTPKEPKDKQPFWKKELSFGSKKAAAGDTPAVAAEETPKVAKPPIWKRELKLGKPKLERSAKTAKSPTAKQPRQKSARNAGSGKAGVVGLKIGASQVAAARISNEGGSPQLLQVAREPLPDGVVVGGELRDIEGLSQALKNLFGKNKLPKRGVRLGIANNRIGVRTFEIVGIEDPKQLANAIRFRAQETLPIPLEEAVLDWQVLSETVDEETGQVTRRVLLVVAYRELVDRYVAACKKAGIRLAGIDLEAFAMLRALALPPPAEGVAPAAQVVVNVGHDRSTFAVSDGRVCEFTRVLSWGGQSLSVAIARALDKTPSEINPIKHALSLVAQFAPPEGISTETLDIAREAVRRELQSFARELVSSLRFYQNQPGSLGIGELVLTGGTAHMPGFADELHGLIGVPVRVGDPLNRVAIPKKFREPEGYSLGSLTVAIGLGIED